jgi:hypothetical protein
MTQPARGAVSRGIRGTYCAVVLALGLGACAAPVDSAEVAEQAEALYPSRDFQIGIRTVKYQDFTIPNPIKGAEEWTNSFSYAALGTLSGSTYSDWTTGVSNPTGLRIALKNAGEGNAYLQNADFQLAIVGENSRDIVLTKWASEGGSGREQPIWYRRAAPWTSCSSTTTRPPLIDSSTTLESATSRSRTGSTGRSPA